MRSVRSAIGYVEDIILLYTIALDLSSLALVFSTGFARASLCSCTLAALGCLYFDTCTMVYTSYGGPFEIQCFLID